MKNFVDTQNPSSRPTGEYAQIIKKIAEDGVCPFCLEHIGKYHKNPIEDKRYWFVTDNMHPYKPSRHHRLVICRRHVSHIDELTTEEWSELLMIVKDEIKKKSMAGGTFIMRFGETRFTGASVTHLHAHIIQSNPDDPSYDKTKGLVMRIG